MPQYFPEPYIPNSGAIMQNLALGQQIKMNKLKMEQAPIEAERARQAAALSQYQDYTKLALDVLKNTDNPELAREIYNRGAAGAGVQPIMELRRGPQAGLYEAVVDPETGQAFVVNTSTGQVGPAQPGTMPGGYEQYPQPGGGGGMPPIVAGTGRGMQAGGPGYLPPPDIDQHITTAASKYGVDPNLLRAIAYTESGYNPGAKGATSDVGLFQFIPGTAKAYGLEDRTDPAASADAAARYVSDLMQQSGGDVRKALSAYNTGSMTSNHGLNIYAPRVLGNYARIKGASLQSETDAATGVSTAMETGGGKLDPKTYIGTDESGMPVVDWNSVNQIKGKQGDRLRESITAEHKRRMDKWARENNKQKTPFEMEKDLRAGYTKDTSTFQDVANSYRTVLSAGDDAAGDLAMIFAFMKMLDPGSVVREGEFATAQNAAGVTERIRNAYNKLLTGERLVPDQRERFRAQSEKTYKEHLKNYKKIRRGYEKVAKNYDLNFENIAAFDTQVDTVKQPENLPPAAKSMPMDELNKKRQKLGLGPVTNGSSGFTLDLPKNLLDLVPSHEPTTGLEYVPSHRRTQ